MNSRKLSVGRTSRLLSTISILVFLSACISEETEPANEGTRDSGSSQSDSEPNPYLDLDEDGYPPVDGDCDDSNAEIGPNGQEVCDDGIDQDCDGADLVCALADQDRDGYTPEMGDCDDLDPRRGPSRLETCDDGIDQDCDGEDLACDDVDNDGDGLSPSEGDCDDTNARRRPGFRDQCGDGIDQDCDGMDAVCQMGGDRDNDGTVDEEDNCPDVANAVQGDGDGDGIGDLCDNCLMDVNQDQADRDNDGVGDACDDDIDRDGDGFSRTAGDCEPDNGAIHPGAEEVCNGLDDDCNGFIDDGCDGVDLRSETRLIAAGPSLLGSQDANPEECLQNPRADENCDEVPLREIELDAFRIEIHEVTNEQYAACVDQERCSPPSNRDAFDAAEFAQHPVVWVSQIQAAMYCAWARGRLPTEAQWERAARGTTPESSRPYPWGADSGNCRANLVGCGDQSVAVGTFDNDQTDTGLSDMIGNVHEFVDGWYDPLYYRRADARNPTGPEGPGMMNLVPIRGGSFSESASFSTLTYRGFRHLMNNRSGRGNVGFRCVRFD